MEVEEVSYVGRHKLPRRFIGHTVIFVVMLGAIALLAFFPETYRDLLDDPSGRGSVVLALPPPVVALIFGSFAAYGAWGAWWTVKAADAQAPLVVMNKGGVTCYDHRGRSTSFAWSDVTRVSHVRESLRFFGGSMGLNRLGSFSTVDQNLDAIRKVVAHFRPDLVQSLG